MTPGAVVTVITSLDDLNQLFATNSILCTSQREAAVPVRELTSQRTSLVEDALCDNAALVTLCQLKRFWTSEDTTEELQVSFAHNEVLRAISANYWGVQNTRS